MLAPRLCTADWDVRGAFPSFGVRAAAVGLAARDRLEDRARGPGPAVRTATWCGTPMDIAISPLVRELLTWLSERPRTDEETMQA